MAQLHGGLSFEEGQHVLFLGTAHYGCLARVLPAQHAGLNQQVGGWGVEVCLPEIKQARHTRLLAFPLRQWETDGKAVQAKGWGEPAADTEKALQAHWPDPRVFAVALVRHWHGCNQDTISLSERPDNPHVLQAC